MSNATIGTRNSGIPTIAPELRVVRPAAPRNDVARSAKPAAPKPAAARPTPPPMPAPGRKTGTPRAEGPGCKARLPAGSVICVECGLCLTTGRVVRGTSVRAQQRIEEEEQQRQIGFLKIGAGIFTRPVATADSLLAHASQPAMLWKILGFIAFTFVAAGYVQSLGHPALFALATGIAVVRFAVFVGCLVLAGSILGERTNFLGAVVGVGFVSGCVQLVGMSMLFALYLVAGQAIQHPGALLFGGLAFLVWALFMHVIAVRSVFGCDTFMACVIAIAAAIIQYFATASLAMTLARAL